MSSIVFFGKAHAGKSTLVGSLVAQSDGLDLDALERRFASEIPNYDPSDLFSSIVDDTRNERERKTGGARGKSGAPGSTKTRHYRNIALDGDVKVTVIDTPGAEHLVKERDRGMFAGEVGVFCLEAVDVINQDFFAKDKQYRAIMTALALWSGLSRGRVVVALTKMDECAFEEAAFNDAREIIRSLCEDLDLASEFVPTCVEVRARRSHNVFTRSETMPWYDGPTLIEALRRHVGEVATSHDREGGLLFAVDREFANPASRAGKIWQVKVLSGTLRQGDRIKLSPVVDSNHDFMSVSAEVKQIRANLHRGEPTRVIEEAAAGAIVGLDLRSITSDGGHRLQKSDFNTLYTTCGFSESAPYAVSQSFLFSVAESYADLFTRGRQFGLIWFGRTVEFEVEAADPWRETLRIRARLITRPIAMPRRTALEFVRSAIIIKTRLKSQEFIQAKLLDIV